MDIKAFNTTLATRLGRDTDDINMLCGQLAEIIGESVSAGDSVTVASFGTFEPKKRNERISVHPGTGKRMLIPPKLSITFKPSVMLKSKIRKS